MATPVLVATGISGLDTILMGGIPRGNLVLVEGGIGTGKTTLGVEFVYRGARHFNEAGMIVLFEASPDRLLRDAAGLGWDLQALQDAGLLQIIYTTRQVFVEEFLQNESVLLESAAAMGVKRMFVDGVPSLSGVTGKNGVEARDTFHVLAESLHADDRTVILAVEATAFSDRRTVALCSDSLDHLERA
jgi:circadian clock protein KaiC